MVDREVDQHKFSGDDVCLRSADLAVKKVFAILGVDIDKPESVEAFREDLRFGKNLRKNVERGWMTVVTALILAVSYAAYDGFIVNINKKSQEFVVERKEPLYRDEARKE